MIARRRTETAETGPEPEPEALANRPEAPDQSIVRDGAESPARRLQQTLATRISDGFAVDEHDLAERWPRRQRLIFLLFSATALWAVTIGLATAGVEIMGLLRA